MPPCFLIVIKYLIASLIFLKRMSQLFEVEALVTQQVRQTVETKVVKVINRRPIADNESSLCVFG